MTNPIVLHMARDLKHASTKNDAPIWSKLAELALKPSSVRRSINVNKINEFTKDGDVIFHPGKVLGMGTISHKITVSSFSISNAAAKKITEAGGKIMNYKEIIEKFPTGKGVKILG
ncbi:MAG: 50S ribosomal protein L18e [Thaumarchaeota archaeon]|nr:50S ribosomal protein L18e [Nitrososphaerota archaeon]